METDGKKTGCKITIPISIPIEVISHIVPIGCHRGTITVIISLQGEDEAMFEEYRKELKVIVNNVGNLVSICHI